MSPVPEQITENPLPKRSFRAKLMKAWKDGLFFEKAFSKISHRIDIRLCRWYSGWLYRRHTPIVWNRVAFCNYNGIGYGCNPKYICEELMKRHPEWEVYWLVSSRKVKDRSAFPAGVQVVPYKSFRALYVLSTSRIWVDNLRKIFFFRRGLKKRRGQIFFQTWHGSLGIKKIAGDVAYLQSKDYKAWLNLAKKDAAFTDFVLTNSTFEEDVFRQALYYDFEKTKILRLGHARNDIFFRDNAGLARDVRRRFGLPDDGKIVLYVPTFREQGETDCYDVDYTRLLDALSKRFGGKWFAFVRLHPRAHRYAESIFRGRTDIFNMDSYNDIQELLAVSDVCITDYSSCIFDFLLSRKPGFLLALDIERYNIERGFYYPLEESPFPVAYNNDKLMENVLSFDEKRYAARVEEFLLEKGCCDDGRASERIVDHIEKFVNKRIGAVSPVSDI